MEDGIAIAVVHLAQQESWQETQEEHQEDQKQHQDEQIFRHCCLLYFSSGVKLYKVQNDAYKHGDKRYDENEIIENHQRRFSIGILHDETSLSKIVQSYLTPSASDGRSQKKKWKDPRQKYEQNTYVNCEHLCNSFLEEQ